MKTTTTKLDKIAKIAKTLGRRFLGVTVERNVATVIVLANQDADDCLDEAASVVRSVVGHGTPRWPTTEEMDGLYVTTWPRPQMVCAGEAVVVEAWL